MQHGKLLLLGGILGVVHFVLLLGEQYLWMVVLDYIVGGICSSSKLG